MTFSIGMQLECLANAREDSHLNQVGQELTQFLLTQDEATASQAKKAIREWIVAHQTDVPFARYVMEEEEGNETPQKIDRFFERFKQSYFGTQAIDIQAELRSFLRDSR